MRGASISMYWLLGGVVSVLCCVRFFRDTQKNRYLSTSTVLSSGQYNVVHIAYDTEKEEHVVMKTIQHASFQTHNGKRLSVYTEGALLSRLDHPCIVKLLEIEHTPKTSRLIMEYCKGENTYDIVCRDGPFSEKTALYIIQNILDTLAYLHRHKIAHRDIRPENIMFDRHSNTVKLIDFEYSKRVQTERNMKFMKTFIDTFPYCAPELMNNHILYDGRCVDVWSLGVTFYVYVCAHFPFRGSSMNGLRMNIYSGLDTYSESFRKCGFVAKRMFMHMLEVDIRKRWSVSQSQACIQQYHETVQV